MLDPSFLESTRRSYDATVAEYVQLVDGLLEGEPLERALLVAFAESVRASGNGPVADVGCGTGRVTAFLREQGLDVFGIDLSPGMVDHARRTYPELRFQVGSMLALDLPDASLAGLLAYYSIIHVPWERRLDVFTEFHRVLAPGGHLMLAFQVGSGVRHLDEAFGKQINCDWYRQQPQDVVGLLRAAGFEHRSTTVREVTGGEVQGPEPLPQGFVTARKPDGPRPISSPG